MAKIPFEHARLTEITGNINYIVKSNAGELSIDGQCIMINGKTVQFKCFGNEVLTTSTDPEVSKIDEIATEDVDVYFA